MLKYDYVSGILESNSCCQSQRTCTQHRNHHSGLSQQTSAIMVLVKPDDESVVDVCDFFDVIYVCLSCISGRR